MNKKIKYIFLYCLICSLLCSCIDKEIPSSNIKTYENDYASDINEIEDEEIQVSDSDELDINEIEANSQITPCYISSAINSLTAFINGKETELVFDNVDNTDIPAFINDNGTISISIVIDLNNNDNYTLLNCETNLNENDVIPSNELIYEYNQNDVIIISSPDNNEFIEVLISPDNVLFTKEDEMVILFVSAITEENIDSLNLNLVSGILIKYDSYNDSINNLLSEFLETTKLDTFTESNNNILEEIAIVQENQLLSLQYYDKLSSTYNNLLLFIIILSVLLVVVFLVILYFILEIRSELKDFKNNLPKLSDFAKEDHNLSSINELKISGLENITIKHVASNDMLSQTNITPHFETAVDKQVQYVKVNSIDGIADECILKTIDKKEGLILSKVDNAYSLEIAPSTLTNAKLTQNKLKSIFQFSKDIKTNDIKKYNYTINTQPNITKINETDYKVTKKGYIILDEIKNMQNDI